MPWWPTTSPTAGKAVAPASLDKESSTTATNAVLSQKEMVGLGGYTFIIKDITVREHDRIIFDSGTAKKRIVDENVNEYDGSQPQQGSFNDPINVESEDRSKTDYLNPQGPVANQQYTPTVFQIQETETQQENSTDFAHQGDDSDDDEEQSEHDARQIRVEDLSHEASAE